MLVPADPAAELVQVGQAVVVGLVDEDGVGVGDVQAALDDRRRHQDVGLAGGRTRASPLPARRSAIWPWPIDDLRLGHDLLQPASAIVVDVVDAVVDEVDLPVAVQLAQDRVADQLGVEAGDARLDRPGGPAAASPGCEMSRMPSSDRCSVRGIGVAVSVSTSTVCRSCLSRSLCSTPKRCSSSMMTRPRSLNCTSLLTQPVRADDDVDAALGQPLRGSRFCSAGVRKRLTHSTTNGYSASRCAEGAVVLLGQHGRRHEDGDLLAVVDRLERGPHGELGLAVADVAADEAVHRPRLAPCRA